VKNITASFREVSHDPSQILEHEASDRLCCFESDERWCALQLSDGRPGLCKRELGHFTFRDLFKHSNEPIKLKNYDCRAELEVARRYSCTSSFRNLPLNNCCNV